MRTLFPNASSRRSANPRRYAALPHFGLIDHPSPRFLQHTERLYSMHNSLRNAFSSILILCGLMVFSGDAFAGKSKVDRAGQRYASLIVKHARANGVPVELARAVVKHESHFDAEATGQAGEIGLMQIKLATARGMGYRGSARGLYDPATNIRWGMKYLGKARKLAGGSECGTLSRYNGGHGTKRMIRGYCKKVMLAKRT
jgi:hypothetical protein